MCTVGKDLFCTCTGLAVAPLAIAAMCLKPGCEQAMANKASFGRRISDCFGSIAIMLVMSNRGIKTSSALLLAMTDSLAW